MSSFSQAETLRAPPSTRAASLPSSPVKIFRKISELSQDFRRGLALLSAACGDYCLLTARSDSRAHLARTLSGNRTRSQGRTERRWLLSCRPSLFFSACSAAGCFAAGCQRHEMIGSFALLPRSKSTRARGTGLARRDRWAGEELYDFAANPKTVAGTPRVIQSWGRRPAA